MTRLLFTLIDGGGSVPPALSVAAALGARGHDVRVLADLVLHDEIRAAGAEPVAWTRAPQRAGTSPTSYLIRDWEARTPLGAFARGRDDVMVGPADRFAADVLEELDGHPADVVVTDLFTIGAQLAAEASGVPVALLAPNPWAMPGWGVPPLGPGFPPARGPLGRARDRAAGAVMLRLFDSGLPRLNEVRAQLGLAPVTSVIGQLNSAALVLVLTSPAFEYAGYAPPAHVRVVGPRLDDPAWAGAGFDPPAGDRPLVLVGLTSTYMKQGPVLQRIATALGRLDVQGLVTTGPNVDPASIDAPSNVAVVQAAPHREVLEHAAAVVTHAGHGTVIKALAAGVPVLAMPMGRDQLDNATRVVHHGAGLRLWPKARPAKIAAAVQRLLGEPSFAQGAQRQAEGIAACLREDRAVTALEELGGGRSLGASREGDAPVGRSGAYC